MSLSPKELQSLFSDTEEPTIYKDIRERKKMLGEGRLNPSNAGSNMGVYNLGSEMNDLSLVSRAVPHVQTDLLKTLRDYERPFHYRQCLGECSIIVQISGI